MLSCNERRTASEVGQTQGQGRGMNMALGILLGASNISLEAGLIWA